MNFFGIISNFGGSYFGRDESTTTIYVYKCKVKFDDIKETLVVWGRRRPRIENASNKQDILNRIKSIRHYFKIIDVLHDFTTTVCT
jgi:hypothetical protein